MAVIVMVSAKCSPGVSASLAALAYAWPRRVLLADCDPAGGDLAAGWLGHWLFDNRLDTGRGVLSFATDTRHASVGEAALLAPHVQQVPVAPHARLLAGLSGPAQHTSVGDGGWRRVAQALGDASATGGWDVLIDVGRHSPATPRPLFAIADRVLVGVRPVPRQVVATRPLLPVLSSRVEPGTLAMAAVASSTVGARDVRRALGLPVAVELPHDARTAAVFADGDRAGEPLSRAPLVVAARSAAAHLQTTLNLRPPPAPLDAAPARADVPTPKEMLR
ncbi:hypothetical protein [Haloechinothrix halophila]|uniref:hypothetical protein n=1 Tax=Haloechinothrix halophila TaxID=1069073 RepID=UPI000420483E|nr:hypothetical protein [Haloechinothrix halophila]